MGFRERTHVRQQQQQQQQQKHFGGNCENELAKMANRQDSTQLPRLLQLQCKTINTILEHNNIDSDASAASEAFFAAA